MLGFVQDWVTLPGCSSPLTPTKNINDIVKKYLNRFGPVCPVCVCVCVCVCV
jgi:hypothetical protein